MAIDERSTWVVMNDGVRLDTTVCTPAGEVPEGGWPTVLLVHGHGDTACKASCLPRARRLAARGYMSVAYSVRGQGASEGLCFHMGPRELFDLQDVIDWIFEQLPAHAERLAVAGSSQGGWHSYMAAAHHPRVATIVPENIFTDYAEFGVMNGCLNRWFFARTMRRQILSAGFQDLARTWALSGEWDLLRAWLSDRSPELFVERIRCPVFILHGWHDVGMPPNQALSMYDKLCVPKKLYLGGGGHDGQDDPQKTAGASEKHCDRGHCRIRSLGVGQFHRLHQDLTDELRVHIQFVGAYDILYAAVTVVAWCDNRVGTCLPELVGLDPDTLHT